MIDALLTMSKADVADVNSLHKTINQAAASTGNQIADRYYAQSITTAEKQLAATEAKAEKAIANAEKQASRIISNAEKWGQWQINTAKAEGDRQIRAAEQRGNRAVWVAKQEGDRAVWVAKQEGDRRVRKATIEGDRAIRKATIEGDRAIRAAKNEGDRQIRAAQNDAAAIQRKLKAETDRVVNAITKALKNPWDMEFKVEVKVGNEPPVVSKPKLNAGNNSPKVTLPKVNVGVVKRAFGGPIIGPGGPRSDLVPLWASNDEHMNAASEVQGAGGHENVYKIRAAMADGTLRRLLDSPAVGLRGDGPMVRVPVGAAQAAQPVQVAVEAPPAIFPEKFELVLDSGETLRGVIRQEASGVVSEQEERRRRRVVQGRQVR
jgi:cell division septum initiation protein DivIVA